jgi:hypothetical protein
VLPQKSNTILAGMVEWLSSKIPVGAGTMPKRRMSRHSVTQPLDASYRLIPLTQGKNTIVDVADFEWLSSWNWYARPINNGAQFYASRKRIKGEESLPRWVQMHVVILGGYGDHKNRNTLDNRRENLRQCTPAQNAINKGLSHRNTSGYKGVSWSAKKQIWKAAIGVNRKQHHLGFFVFKEDAADAYNKHAREMHGEFAVLNVLPKDFSPRSWDFRTIPSNAHKQQSVYRRKS